MTVSQAKTWYSISFNLTSRVQIISDHKHISCSLMLLRSTKHISWPLWWWWWYELLSIRVRPYKSSKFKAQIGENILQKLWRVVIVAKALTRLCRGPTIPKQTAGTTGDKEIAPKVLAPRGQSPTNIIKITTRSSHWKCSKKELFHLKMLIFCQGSWRKFKGGLLLNLKVVFFYK